jgi:TIR domain
VSAAAVAVVLVCCGTLYWFTRTTVELVPGADQYRVIRAGRAVLDAGSIAGNVHIRVVADKDDFVDALLVVRGREFVAGCWGDRATAYRELGAAARRLSAEVRHPSGESQYDRLADRYALFLSYKSEDANVVRAVADWLSAAGVSVWFDEYTILLRGREGFDAAIRRGATHSAGAVAFTHALYAGSEYCTLELRELLRTCGPGRVLEVQMRDDIPPDVRARYPFGALLGGPERPCLDDCLRTAFGGARAVYERLKAHFPGLGLAPLPPDEPRDAPATLTGSYCGVPYSIDHSGWEVRSAGVGPTPEGNCDGPYLARVFNGYPAYCKLMLGPEPPGSNPLGDGAGRGLEGPALLDSVREFAAGWVDASDSVCRGVHVFIDRGGRRHVGLTYWIRSEFQWQRRYSVVLPQPGGHAGGRPREFAFTFGFFGPFREFCRVTHLLEAVVSSLRWGAPAAERPDAGRATPA